MSINFPFLLFNWSSLPESSEEREVEEGDCRGVSSGDAAMELVVEEEVETRSSELWTKLLRAVVADMAAIAASCGKFEVNIDDSCEDLVDLIFSDGLWVCEKNLPLFRSLEQQAAKRSETRGRRSLPVYTIDPSGRHQTQSNDSGIRAE